MSDALCYNTFITPLCFGQTFGLFVFSVGELECCWCAFGSARSLVPGVLGLGLNEGHWQIVEVD